MGVAHLERVDDAGRVAPAADEGLLDVGAVKALLDDGRAARLRLAGDRLTLVGLAGSYAVQADGSLVLDPTDDTCAARTELLSGTWRRRSDGSHVGCRVDGADGVGRADGAGRQPGRDDPRFLTWVGEGADVDRAVRFLIPLGVYRPGETVLGPVPEDYVRYLRGLRRSGADVSRPRALDVGGHRGVVLTASTETGLSGSLGCQERGLVPDDCFGLQPFALLHIAVVRVDGRLLVAWARTIPGADEAEADFAAFEELLAGLDFRTSA